MAGTTLCSRRFLLTILKVCLGLFFADAIVSLADDSWIVLFNIQSLTVIRGIVLLMSSLVAFLVYVLMGIIPAIPKRLFLPVTLFNPFAGLILIPVLIASYGQSQRFSLAVSFCQLLLGLGLLSSFKGGFKIRWPILEDWLMPRRFSWLSFAGFLLVNVFALLPTVIIYLFICASLAINHFSDGFVSLRPSGLMVQVREYVRDDGKTIELFPMSHVAEGDFYHRVQSSFQTNSVVLMEGVTDHRNLITNQISYKRVARTLGLVEQQKEFRPGTADWVRADVDVEVFGTNTINFLNLVMRMYSKGLKAETLLPVIQYSPSPEFQEQIFDDLLRKRNHHLLKEIDYQLLRTDKIIVPWGAAHMPEIAREIQKDGFRLNKTWNYEAIRFGFRGGKQKKPILSE
jgi:hypothetical protein